MNLKQLKYVIVLANTGSFSKAAELLGISQPSLSQYVKKIEQQIGIELFERTGGAVRITDAGRVYIEIGRKILELENQMQNSFLDLSLNKTGSIIVGTSPFRSATLMPAVAADFKKKYPGVHIVVAEMESHELTESAEHGEFDICVTNLPLDNSIFECEMIAEESLVLAVKRKSELDKYLSKQVLYTDEWSYPVIDMKILDDKQFVMLTDNQLMQKILNYVCAEEGISLQKAVVVKSIEAQIEMVKQGVGAALVPTGIIKLTGRDERISYYSFSRKIPKRILGVIYTKGKHISAPVRDLIDIIKKHAISD